MEMESKFKEKGISLDLFGCKTQVPANDELLSKCEEIKALASRLLEKIKGNADMDVNQTVTTFLTESIERLTDKNAVNKIFDGKEPSITELTGVLCYIIAEIGGAFEGITEEACDEE